MKRLFTSKAAEAGGSSRNLKVCAFCEEISFQPHQGSCTNHVYCYFCVRNALEQDENVKCPKCDEKITSVIKPLQTSS